MSECLNKEADIVAKIVRDHVNYVLGLINTFLMQCVLSPTEMNQKTYITADHHVALNADNEQ
jgi:hypothetical protein